MTSAAELAKLGPQFRGPCACCKDAEDPCTCALLGIGEGACEPCRGLGYVPLMGAALLEACLEWCKDGHAYLVELLWPPEATETTWKADIEVQEGNLPVHGEGATASDALAAAVVKAMIEVLKKPC